MHVQVSEDVCPVITVTFYISDNRAEQPVRLRANSTRKVRDRPRISTPRAFHENGCTIGHSVGFSSLGRCSLP
jgi:hypothetical protein